MRKHEIISGRIEPAGWALTHSRAGHAGGWLDRAHSTRTLVVANHDGTELQPMLSVAVRKAGATGLADTIDALSPAAVVGFDGGAARDWHIEYVNGGGYSAQARVTLSDGSDPAQDDYGKENHLTVKAAVAWVATALGHADLGALIAAS